MAGKRVMNLTNLARRAAEFGVTLDAGQLAAFSDYGEELRAWNQRVNLTSITEPEQVEIRHFVDSLSALLALDGLFKRLPAPVLIDVGSGAGFPGIPLRLACPSIRLTLLESVRKKTIFLEHIVTRLGLERVEVVTGRAEVVGRDDAHRERYDAALARALGPLPVLLELCLPFVRPGGRLVASRRGELEADQAACEQVAAELGGRFEPPIPVDLAPRYSGYGLVVVNKIAPTPERYPRRVGIPAKRPL